jgi:hypothetical protein
MSGPSVLNILERFKHGYMQFIDELLEQFPDEPDLIIIRVFFEDQVPVSVVADGFIDHVLPHRDMISTRNEKFFLENNHMFGMLDNGKVLHFKKLWTSSRLDKDDRDAIWKWFETFCTLVDAYRKSK